MSDIQTKFNQALQLHQSGKMREAITLYLKILPMQKNNAYFFYMLGIAYLQLGRHISAIEKLQRSLENNLDKSLVSFAHINIGIALQNLKRNDEALASYDKALAINPMDAETNIKRGNTLQDLGRFEEALKSYDQALVINADYAVAYNNRGNVLKDLQRFEEALKSYDQALMINADYAVAYNNRGNVLKDLQRFEEALASYDKALQSWPDYVEAHNNRGNVLKELRYLEEALKSYDKALQLRPNFAMAYNNRGNALKDLKRFYEALACYDKALEIAPDNPETYYNRGVALEGIKRFQEALACYDKAITLRPDYAEANWNKSLLLILAGLYLEGWKLYEWRLYKEDSKYNYYSFLNKRWLGQSVPQGTRIFIYAEQGIGDTIQFCRYLSEIAAMGAKLLFEVPVSLVTFVSTLNVSMVVSAKGSSLPEFDVYCPLMSLPHAFQTTLESIPAKIPYLFSDPDKKARWQHKLGKKKRLRVGLAWSGSTVHKNDANRSIRLKELLSLIDLPVEWHSLQKEYRQHDQDTLIKYTALHQHQDELQDFSDTAALIECLDLVITVDTSVAHTTGALGKPVWILLPYLSDYRWMVDREDTPWYPTARLFRQHQDDGWESVVGKVRNELLALI